LFLCFNLYEQYFFNNFVIFLVLCCFTLIIFYSTNIHISLENENATLICHFNYNLLVLLFSHFLPANPLKRLSINIKDLLCKFESQKSVDQNFSNLGFSKCRHTNKVNGNNDKANVECNNSLHGFLGDSEMILQTRIQIVFIYGRKKICVHF